MKKIEKSKDDYATKLSDALLSIAQVLFCLFMLIISIVVVFFTGHSLTDTIDPSNLLEQQEFWGLDSLSSAGMIAMSFVASAIILLTLFFLHKRNFFNIKPKVFVFACALFLLVSQTIWIASLNAKTYTFADTQIMRITAEYTATGHFNPAIFFTHESDMLEYFQSYPFQAGAEYVFLFFYGLFGENATQIYQFANALSNTGIALLLVRATWLISKKREPVNICALLCATCLPLIFSCSFEYTNSIGLLFAVLAIILTMESLEQNSTKRNLIMLFIAFVSITISMMIKNTNILFLIVMFVLMLIEAIKKKSVGLASFAIVLALVANMTSGVPVKVLENQMGESFGKGMPKNSWIAMGLTQKDESSLPGWWYRIAFDIRDEASWDYDEQVRISNEVIKDSCTHFLKDPLYATNFFKQKIVSEWSDPMFQSIYCSNLCAGEGYEGRNYGALARSVLYGKGGNLLHIFGDGMQNIIVVCALFYGISLFRKRKGQNHSNRTLQCILPSCVVLGFFVYLLWEAKSMYLMPFYLCMLPLTAIQLEKYLDLFAHKKRLTKLCIPQQ